VKYAVITFGCRVNQADSLSFEEELCAAGATAAPPEHADLVIVNTCSVTSSADQAARQATRRVARQNPAAKIVVTGCYATRSPEEVASLGGALRVVPNPDKARLISIAIGEPGLTTSDRFGSGDGGCGATVVPGIAGRTAFTLRVQTGCAEQCAYCIIPTTRGAPHSVAIPDVLREATRVCAAGFKEISLTGVHLGSYGRDLTPRSSLSALLQALVSAAPPALFRISSLEPMDCTAEIVDLVATDGVFAPHFHLPLQHASDKILASMRRPYTIAQYGALVEGIRRRLPHAAIGTDVIVGYPGETDAEAQALVDYIEGSPLTHVHVFPYSDRPGTVAASMAGKVHGALIRERARRVREAGHCLSARFRASQVGTVRPGLTLEDGTLVVTDNYLKVRVPPGLARNEWVRVAITTIAGTEMSGQAAVCSRHPNQDRRVT